MLLGQQLVENQNLSSLNVFELYFARTHTHLHLDVHKSVHQRRKQISIKGNLNVTLTTINNRHSKCVFLSIHIDTFKSWELHIRKRPKMFSSLFLLKGPSLPCCFESLLNCLRLAPYTSNRWARVKWSLDEGSALSDPVMKELWFRRLHITHRPQIQVGNTTCWTTI